MTILINLGVECDGPPVYPPVKVGDIVWAYDEISHMKIPMKVVRTYGDGYWDGVPAWDWGHA